MQCHSSPPKGGDAGDLFHEFLGLGGAVGEVGYFDVEAGEWRGAFVALEVVVAHGAHRFRCGHIILPGRHLVGCDSNFANISPYMK